jgi:hypothetical protein
MIVFIYQMGDGDTVNDIVYIKFLLPSFTITRMLRATWKHTHTTKQKEIKKDTAPTWCPDGSIVLFYIYFLVVIISLSPKDYL